jgi:hypothetical protein
VSGLYSAVDDLVLHYRSRWGAWRVLDVGQRVNDLLLHTKFVRP